MRGARRTVMRASAVAARIRPNPRIASANRYRHHQSAVGDERVTSALEAQRCLRAHVAIPYLAVIADRLDRLVGIVVRDAELRPEVAADTEQALHVGILRAALGVDIGLRDA